MSNGSGAEMRSMCFGRGGMVVLSGGIVSPNLKELLKIIGQCCLNQIAVEYGRLIVNELGQILLRKLHRAEGFHFFLEVGWRNSFTLCGLHLDSFPAFAVVPLLKKKSAPTAWG